jgi:uncharacterized membrane protein
MLAIFLGWLSAVLWGTADFISRKTAKSIGYYLTAAYLQLIGCVVCVAFAIHYGEHLPYLKPNFLLLNVVLGLLVLVSLVFLYRGLSQGTMSIVAPISGGMGPAVAVVLSVIILGQVVVLTDAYAIAGVILGVILSGVKFSELRSNLLHRSVLPTLSSDSKLCENVVRSEASSDGMWGGLRITKGLDSAIVSAVAAGSVYLGLGVLIPQIGWLFPIIIMKATGALAAFGFMLLAKGHFKIPSCRTVLWLILMGTMDVAGMLAFSFGIMTAGGYLPIVVTFSGLSGVVVLMLARFFYKERLDTVQTAGVFLVIICAMTLLYFQ